MFTVLYSSKVSIPYEYTYYITHLMYLHFKDLYTILVIARMEIQSVLHCVHAHSSTVGFLLILLTLESKGSLVL